MMNLEQCEIKQLKQENEQLRAHVKRLAITLKYLKGFEDDLDHIELIEIQLEATPAQSLQQIKRDAVLEAVEKAESEFLAYVKEYEFTEIQRKVLMGAKAFRNILKSQANNLVKDGE